MGYTYHQSRRICPKAVHPHSRGVYAYNRYNTNVWQAVHPHSRGVYAGYRYDSTTGGRFIPTRVGYTYITSHAGYVQGRFIPTRVGYTPSPSTSLSWRGRFIPTRVGYTIRSFLIDDIKDGSSPLAWGILYIFVNAGFNSTGSSPLAWGIPYVYYVMIENKSVHPHSRGVYQYSSDDVVAYGRFIPTRVGYTSPLKPLSYAFNGSSPLAWGIPSEDANVTIWQSVHPHSRGVYFSVLSMRNHKSTVHPHSRGVYLIRQSGSNGFRRFIPTRVGYTQIEATEERRKRRFIPTRVGYTQGVSYGYGSYYGSSPLAWGILSRCRSPASSPAVHPHSRGVYTN